jgi:DNA-binding PadR family transcriptional regulator
MATRTNLSFAAAAVLQAVAGGYRYGFDIMDASGLPGGTVYPALRRLERAGYVKSKWEADAVAKTAKRPRRRYYEISKTGNEALAAALKRFPLLRRPVAGESLPGEAVPS